MEGGVGGVGGDGREQKQKGGERETEGGRAGGWNINEDGAKEKYWVHVLVQRHTM